MSRDFVTLRAHALSAARGLRAHLFSVVVLAPMILAGFYYILSPNVTQAGGWLRRAAQDWTGADLVAAGFLLMTVLTAAGLPSALRHVYALGLPAAYLDALPISPSARFRSVLVGQCLRNLPAWAALAAVFHLLAPGRPEATMLRPASASLLILELAALQILTALTLVHFGLLRSLRLLVLGAVVLALCLSTRFEPLIGFVMAPMLAGAAFFQSSLAAALEMELVPRGWLSEWPAQAAWAVALALLSRAAYVAWRDAEVERAQAASRRKAWGLANLERTLMQRFGDEVGVQIARDLRLTLRGATPAVWTCAAAATLFLAALPAAILNHWVPEQWLPLLLVTLTALATLSLSALAPVLLQSHWPSLWVEHTSGAPPEAMLKARKYFALIVSFPVAVGAFAATALMPGPWTEAASLAARMALAWITVSTLIGAVAFDIAAAPAIGLMLAGLISLGICGMYGFGEFWPIGLFLYGYLIHHLNERAEGAASHVGESA